MEDLSHVWMLRLQVKPPLFEHPTSLLAGNSRP